MAEERSREVEDSASRSAQVDVSSLPSEMDLEVLVEYASQRLGLRILYDEDLTSKRVSIRSADGLSVGDLEAVMHDALRMHDLALVEAGTQGWWQIVPIKEAMLRRPVRHGEAGQAVVSEFIPLEHMDPANSGKLIESLLSQMKGSAVASQEGGVLVMDYRAQVERARELVRLLDQPSSVQVRFVAIEHGSPAQIAEQAQKILRAKFGGGRDEGGRLLVQSIVDPRTNQLALIGRPTVLAEAAAIIASLDQAVPQEQSPVRQYQLANATAAEVLDTIRRLEGDSGVVIGDIAPVKDERDRTLAAVPVLAERAEPFASSTPLRAAVESLPQGTATERATGEAPDETAAGASQAMGRTAEQADGGSARVRITADEHTNSIIVIGPPEAQRLYASLIEMLDQRRPQVLIETTIVSIDTTDDFELGVELAARDDGGEVLLFSSFGISIVDAATGGLRLPTPTPAGGTAAILGPDEVDIVINALRQNSRTKVLSAPRLLVNDNNEGVLEDIREEPFEVSLVTPTAVAQRGFGGFAEAGTRVLIRPQISEDDYLTLRYAIELSSFSGTRTAELPPPRRRTMLQSDVTVPDASTVVVGGLNLDRDAELVSKVPLLGDVPLVKHLFRRQSDSVGRQTFFVFIRPTILRDQSFDDLKHLSRHDRVEAEQPDDAPSSRPVLMR